MHVEGRFVCNPSFVFLSVLVFFRSLHLADVLCGSMMIHAVSFLCSVGCRFAVEIDRWEFVVRLSMIYGIDLTKTRCVLTEMALHVTVSLVVTLPCEATGSLPTWIDGLLCNTCFLH
jgi:hypothetical protein